LAEVARNGKSLIISVVADGLLHYKLNYGKWIKKLQCGPCSPLH